jgi:hypothetical protein
MNTHFTVADGPLRATTGQPLWAGNAYRSSDEDLVPNRPADSGTNFTVVDPLGPPQASPPRGASSAYESDGILGSVGPRGP